MPMIGLGLGLALHKGGGYSPITALGSKLIAWWDSSVGISLSGSAVTAWADRVAGYSAAQGLSASRPQYSATSFNGSPGLTWDGSDDFLQCTNAALLALLPTGAVATELLSVLQQDSLVADTAERRFFGYAGASSNNGRQSGRSVNAGANTTYARTGSGAAITDVTGVGDFSGRHVVHDNIGATTTTVTLSNGSPTGGAVVPNSQATQVNIGASSLPTPAAFFKGVSRHHLITTTLTTDERAALIAWALTQRNP